MDILLNKKFSHKYKQLLLLRHLIGSIGTLIVLGVIYYFIVAIYDNNFYNALENTFGRELAHLIHDYEPAVIVFGVVLSELVVWIIVEGYSSRKILKVMDNIDTIFDSSIDTIALPTEFSELQNWLNYLKIQNREQQRLSEIETQKKSDVLTYLAHDIRTPLASVIGYLSLLCEAPDMPSEQRNKFTHTAFSKALQFEKLIDDFFDITRYNLSENAIIKKEVDLCFLLEQLSDEFYPLLHQKELQLHLDIPDTLSVLVDGEKIARVFNNVTKNAITYSYPKTTIEISVKSTQESVVITVKNDGKTISQDKLECIFDRFYRANETYGVDENGTGLGLAIAKEIMRLHNGNITAESAGEITSFIIILPIEKG